FPSCTAFVASLRTLPAISPADPQAGTQAAATTRGPAAAPGTGTGAPPLTRVPRPSQLISRPMLDPTVTQSLGPSVVTMQRPAYVAASAPVPQLPVAPSERVGPGTLLPAVVIGVGAAGDRVVRYLRRAVNEQYGGTEAVPHLRLFTVDTDPDASHGN